MSVFSKTVATLSDVGSMTDAEVAALNFTGAEAATYYEVEELFKLCRINKRLITPLLRYCKFSEQIPSLIVSRLVTFEAEIFDKYILATHGDRRLHEAYLPNVSMSQMWNLKNFAIPWMRLTHIQHQKSGTIVRLQLGVTIDDIRENVLRIRPSIHMTPYFLQALDGDVWEIYDLMMISLPDHYRDNLVYAMIAYLALPLSAEAAETLKKFVANPAAPRYRFDYSNRTRSLAPMDMPSWRSLMVSSITRFDTTFSPSRNATLHPTLTASVRSCTSVQTSAGSMDGRGSSDVS